ncbi:MAG: CoA transferase, partial [Ruthenibacterium sp.]
METAGLLEGVRVLDLSRVLAGPYCAMALADMGADVIKIEAPIKGDDSRGNAPLVNGESAYFINLNRNKRGITLNLKSEEGKKIFCELVKKSDIVVENFRPGLMERLGLGYEDLKKINPAIIYGAVSGFGHYGPYSKRAGYDIVGQAMSGL